MEGSFSVSLHLWACMINSSSSECRPFSFFFSSTHPVDVSGHSSPDSSLHSNRILLFSLLSFLLLQKATSPLHSSPSDFSPQSFILSLLTLSFLRCLPFNHRHFLFQISWAEAHPQSLSLSRVVLTDDLFLLCHLPDIALSGV